MPRFTTRTEVPHATAEAAFDLIVDLSQWSSFPGWGPVPGIREATCDDSPLRLGSRVRVENTDKSVHHETIVEFERPRRIRLQMELGPPANRVMRSIDELVTISPAADGNGIMIERTFTTTARWFFTWPLTLLVGKVFLRRAVLAHNRIVSDTLRQSTRGTTAS